MKKADFIGELSGRLIVLTDEERQEILDEYEQHINMKVESGMSEEEAIADFGKIEELAADILEAYHVRADYAIPEKKKSDVPEKLRQSAGGMCKGVRTFCRKICGICKRIGSGIKQGIKKAVRAVGKGFGRLKGGVKNIGRKREMTKEKHRSISYFFGNLFWACAAALHWCFRVCWNLLWACAGVAAGFGTCTVVFTLGLLVVMLILGYPLIGFTVGCVGLVLCLGSATVACFSFFIRKKQDKPQEEKVEETVSTEISMTEEEVNHA